MTFIVWGISMCHDRQLQATAAALEERKAEVILQLPQLVADCAMGQMKLCSGAGDAAAARDSNKSTQAPQWRCSSITCQFSSHVT